MEHFFVYILKCADGTFYTGWTLSLEKRLHEHNKGTASKYTRTRLPVSIVFSETHASKSDALKREIAIKKLRRLEKEKLVSQVTNR